MRSGGNAVIHLTSLARILFRPGRLHSLSSNQLSDSLLHLIAIQAWNDPRKIRHRVQISILLDDCETYRVHVGIENIGTVGQGFHPLLLDGIGAWSHRDVFRDRLKLRSGLRRPIGQRRLSRIVMRHLRILDHQLRMLPRGISQRGAPAQRRESLIGTRFIGCGKESLFGRRSVRRSRSGLCACSYSPGQHPCSHDQCSHQVFLLSRKYCYRHVRTPGICFRCAAQAQLKPILTFLSGSLAHPAILCDYPFLNAFAISAPTRSQRLLISARSRPLAAAGITLLFVFICCAVFAPWVAPDDPASIDLSHRLAGPEAAHWFGTDELGRDILSRVIYGARISLTVSVSVVTCSLFLGIVFGGIAGFYGGPLDVLLNTFVMNAFLALPGILLAIAFVAFLGPGMMNLILALSIGGWVGYARLVRAQVLAVKEREFVEAARALGASNLRIFTRHILPNIVQPLIVQSAIGMAGVVLAEATLSFLGLGVPPPASSWGNMLNDARSHLFDSPHMVIFPALAMMLCVLSFNFIGDALRDYLDPRTRLTMGI